MAKMDGVDDRDLAVVFEVESENSAPRGCEKCQRHDYECYPGQNVVANIEDVRTLAKCTPSGQPTAGITFADEGKAAEDRIFGGRTFYPTDTTSPDVASSETREDAASRAD